MYTDTVMDKKQHPEATILLEWYDASRRILPWREDPTPYHVWLSEIMLQQTRVEAATDYYLRFLKALPDVASLAAAPEDQYMKLWEGLGYYSRIRNMHKAACQIMEHYGGTMPGTAAELSKLAGIGEYTAAAIASIAFGEAVPSVDGNLLRVFARLTSYGENIKDKAAKAAATEYYRARIPGDRPGDYNQALMDLGATVCLPNGAPLCDRCPLSGLCKAHADSREQDFPVVPAKASRKVEKMTIFLITDGTRVIIRKRPDQGLLAGLYEFPNISGALTKSKAEGFVREMGLEPAGITKTPAARHIFSHKEWHMTGYLVQVPDLDPVRKADPAVIAATTQELRDVYSIPSAFSAFLKILLSQE